MKESDIVAFKCKDKQQWFTGIVERLIEAGEITSVTEDWYYISVILPIKPQWKEDDEKTIYYPNDIVSNTIIILE